jgi:hypothetical protein
MARAWKMGSNVRDACVVAMILTVLGIAVGNAALGWVVGLGAFGALLYVMSKVPLRISLMVLTFCALVLENPSDLPAAGFWQSPLYVVGALLLTHLNNSAGLAGFSFSGMDVIIAFLFYVAWSRRSSGSKLDTAEWVPSPKPLLQLAWVSFAGIGWMLLFGMIRGGDFSMALAQILRVVYLPVVFLLFHVGLRGPRDFVALGKVLIAAAVVRALLATYVMNFVPLPPDYGDDKLPYGTSHHDSVLFASATILLITLVMHRAGPWAKRLALMVVPILVAGMAFNNRRMVWVQTGLVFVVLYFATPMTAAKRRLRRNLLYMSPVIALYIAVGWTSTAAPFKPVQSIRQAFEPATDVSAMTREIENYDLIQTFRQQPVFGTGLGHGYIPFINLPPMPYPLEPYCPHNSFLGVWVYYGYFGYTAITLLWVAGVYFGMRSYYSTKDPIERTAALMSFANVLIYFIQCWGDIGLGSWTAVFTVSPAIAVAGKLAVASGAWPVKGRKLAPAATAFKARSPGQVRVAGSQAGEAS